MSDEKPRQGELRAWWVPQAPMGAFHVPVHGLTLAALLLEALAAYDMFQFQHKVKPDFCNAGGLEVYDNGEWRDWESGGGEDIEDWARANVNLPDLWALNGLPRKDP